jgi:3-hydroxyisobutyrate dehydrogenase-like beta-hydroxyacid dehydrogenase
VHEAGFDLTVCRRNQQALAVFAAHGVKVVRQPSDCAGAHLVLVLVSTTQLVLDVVVGEHEVSSTQEGPDLIVAVMATM